MIYPYDPLTSLLSAPGAPGKHVAGGNRILNHSQIGSGRERGQAVLLLVLGLSFFLIGALGLAIDGGQMYAQRQMAQTAADAAAQAGIMSLFAGTNATSAFPFGTGSPPVRVHLLDRRRPHALRIRPQERIRRIGQRYRDHRLPGQRRRRASLQ